MCCLLMELSQDTPIELECSRRRLPPLIAVYHHLSFPNHYEGCDCSECFGFLSTDLLESFILGFICDTPPLGRSKTSGGLLPKNAPHRIRLPGRPFLSLRAHPL